MEQRSAAEHSTIQETIDKATEIFRQIIPNAEGAMDIFGRTYLTADYTDELNRWAEVRMRPDTKKLNVFNLHANLGDGLALLELKNRLEKEGVQIGSLSTIIEDKEETKAILARYSK